MSAGSDDGPYRSGGVMACPTCATVLIGEADRACPKGCGEWTGAALVEERWGEIVDVDGDARLKWRTANTPVACVVCKQAMKRVLHTGWSSYRCRDHGVWFAKDARDRFEREQAGPIARHQAQRAEVERTMAMIRAAADGDARRLREFATRLLLLEQDVREVRAFFNLVRQQD